MSPAWLSLGLMSGRGSVGGPRPVLFGTTTGRVSTREVNSGSRGASIVSIGG